MVGTTSNEPTISIEMILGLSMSSSGFSVDPAAVLPEGMGSSEVRAMTFLLMSSTSLARSSTRRVQDHTQSNQTHWVSQDNHLHFFWDHGLHSGQMEETGRQGKPSFQFLGHTTLTMKLKRQKLEKHSKILNLSGKRKRVIIWCHYSQPRAFVVYLSRTTKLPLGSWKMGNLRHSGILTKRNASTCHGYRNRKRGDGMI